MRCWDRIRIIGNGLNFWTLGRRIRFVLRIDAIGLLLRSRG
jgi:hypothetical protein